MEKSIELIKEFNDLNLSATFDFDKFNHYAIVHHSATIEGSTLTEIETRLLLDENLTPKGKPLDHSLMVSDHYAALLYILEPERKSTRIIPHFIKEINARVMKRTGTIVNTALGTIDSSKGELRKSNVSAGNTYFVSYDKVEQLLIKLCDKLNETLGQSLNTLECLNLSFDAHFDLVTIHPFYDGNGRTSRLLMNYLQHITNLPLGIVFKEDKNEYYEALVNTRKEQDMSPFRAFMHAQYQKLLLQEIEKFRNVQKPSTGQNFSLIF